MECVEWRTSTYSSNSGCVTVGNGIKVRDSKNPDGTILQFGWDTWENFITTVKSA